MKNYIGFINDHSGSMSGMEKAAIADYNANITATKDAASREMLDTVVSVIAVGGNTERQVVISNPHVLRPVTSWRTGGGTPLWGGILDMIALFEKLPDANKQDVSFLVLATTDGQATDTHMKNALVEKIAEMQRTGRWTFVFRVPHGFRHYVQHLGVPDANIQEWETTSEGMAASTAQTTQAMSNYYSARSAGATSSTVFYANAQAVNVTALKDVTKDVSLYVVPADKMGIEIRDFILTKRMQYLKGSAFYQLTKTEPRVQHTKMIAIRDRSTGKIYAGAEARKMIGLPTDRNARLHPGDHGNYDIFIQSESVNRKLVAGTGVLYWEAIGKPFTEADLAFFKPKEAAPAVVQLPAVAPTNKPTPSPIAKAKPLGYSVDGKPVEFFATREQARQYGRTLLPFKSVQDVNDYRARGSVVTGNVIYRWFVFL